MAGYKREVAYRMFAKDLAESVVIEKDTEDEYAAQYVKTASGAKANRVFICGTMLEAEDHGDDTPFWRVKISDTEGVFNCTLGMYSPQTALDMVELLDVPSFVAVVGKIKPNEYNEKTYFNIAIESITPTTRETCDRWVEETTRQTAARIDESENI